ncbi:MAG: hypothetical protein ABI387_16730 [Lacunisphaera sp.]
MRRFTGADGTKAPRSTVDDLVIDVSPRTVRRGNLGADLTGP